MHDLYNLKEMLVEELAEYGKKKDVSLSDLEVLDKLAHATKNIDKVIECYQEQAYSNRSYDGGSYRMSRNDYNDYNDYGNYSGRRGRARNGRFVSRDGSEMAHQLREMMNDAPDERMKSEIERLASKIESM